MITPYFLESFWVGCAFVNYVEPATIPYCLADVSSLPLINQELEIIHIKDSLVVHAFLVHTIGFANPWTSLLLSVIIILPPWGLGLCKFYLT